MERDRAPSQSLAVRQTAATPSPDKVVDAVLCYWPDVPRLSPLVRLPNMSTPAQEPRAGHTLGVLSLLLYGSSGMS